MVGDDKGEVSKYNADTSSALDAGYIETVYRGTSPISHIQYSYQRKLVAVASE